MKTSLKQRDGEDDQKNKREALGSGERLGWGSPPRVASNLSKHFPQLRGLARLNTD